MLQYRSVIHFSKRFGVVGDSFLIGRLWKTLVKSSKVCLLKMSRPLFQDAPRIFTIGFKTDSLYFLQAYCIPDPLHYECFGIFEIIVAHVSFDKLPLH